MVDCPIETCTNFVAMAGTFCSAECYSEWLSVRLYEATDNYDPFTAYQVAVPIKLEAEETPPLPLVFQPWYHGFIGGEE